MTSVSSLVNRRIVIFLLFSLLIMAEPTTAPLTANDAPSTNTGTLASTRTNPRTHRHHQSFKGQNLDLWKVVITGENLKAAHYNKVKHQTLAVTDQLCTGDITHVLKAIVAGTDTFFTKPTLTSATPTEGEKMEFKIARSEYSDDMRTYNNNKSKLAQSLLSQRAPSVTEQLKEMKDHSTGHYDILWVLSALSQMCSGISSDESPLLQVYNAIRKVFNHRQ